MVVDRHLDHYIVVDVIIIALIPHCCWHRRCCRRHRRHDNYDHHNNHNHHNRHYCRPLLHQQYHRCHRQCRHRRRPEHHPNLRRRYHHALTFVTLTITFIQSAGYSGFFHH